MHAGAADAAGCVFDCDVLWLVIEIAPEAAPQECVAHGHVTEGGYQLLVIVSAIKLGF